MNIPFFKPNITAQDFEYVGKALSSGWLTYGEENIRFEKELCDYTGAKFCLTVNSCTAALHLALLAVGVKEGDYVITTPYTFVATANAIRYCGATPRFVDVGYDYNISPQRLSKADFIGVKAVIAVDFAGNPCDYEAIRKVVPDRIPIIGDAAHSISASYKGKKIGNVADITCFSFYATKCMTTGDGGAILTNNKEWAERIRILGLNGLDKGAWKRYSDKNMWKYDTVEVGFKYNMQGMSAALGRSQLMRVDTMRKERNDIRHFYDSELDGVCILPPHDEDSSCHLYIIGVEQRDKFVANMAERGIHCSVHCIPVPSFTAYGNQDMAQWPVCQELYLKAVSLPIYPGLTGSEQGYITNTVKELAEDNL